MMTGAPRRGPVEPAHFRALQKAGLKLEEKGLVCGTDGNLSLRDLEGGLVITASGAHKGDLKAEDLIRIDLEGRILWGSQKPSSESAMHRVIYQKRSDVQAVVHAHPPVGTAFAVAGCCLQTAAMPESIVMLGEVPYVRYATPGTEDLSRALEAVLPGHNAFLLAHHGAVTLGETLQQALDRMSLLEHTARILLAARLLGGAKPLPSQEVQKLTCGQPMGPLSDRQENQKGQERPALAPTDELVRVVAAAVLRHLKEEDS
ncbi:MAG: class II aldolase/adducin family protein [Candidatus Eisenbacteria bacterium]|uniref:Class II aldolase/adducin family protein n=1 Tax=Eiseniibacteriota bacterium TaxID=2212470 RepID=A0A948RUV6_UNCEI|nr:class II aldolase/adducin family protein [Candidatus Eisenbacteria bacterium]MBU1948626.1 class II aldolase/adducin family protein [Candidatus Eisenbacteria bacterium]MBU2689382.1 class II aldolase/adducin family protein [Candidatus Eisenbacteria bacterium]